MGKRKIPEDTRTVHCYNANAKNKFGSDCVVRAISTALNQSWEDTVREMTEVGISIGYVLNDTHTTTTSNYKESYPALLEVDY